MTSRESTQKFEIIWKIFRARSKPPTWSSRVQEMNVHVFFIGSALDEATLLVNISSLL